MASTTGGNPLFANVYAGTSTGSIGTVSKNLIGCRIVKDEHIGTVKYVGPISNSAVTWLGVDWDVASNGRHDGTFKGFKYFTASQDTSGSFLKPEKASLGASLEEALSTRYAMCAECQIVTRNAALFQPGGDPALGVKLELGNNKGQLKATMDVRALEAEYLGNEKPATSCPFTVEIFTSSSGELNNHRLCGAPGVEHKLSRLRVATVPGMPVYRGLKSGEYLKDDVRTLWPGPGGQMGSYLSALQELDISGCLVSKWTEVAQICQQLPHITKLNVSNNRLRLPRLTEHDLSNLSDDQRRLCLDVETDIEEAESICSSAFPGLVRFVAVQMQTDETCGFIFGWSEIKRILGWMPSVKEICIAYNTLGDLPNPDQLLGAELKVLLSNFSEVDLTATEQSDFNRILSVLGESTELKELILNVNKVPKISLPDNKEYFPCLTNLGIRDNLISDWESINELSRFLELRDLIISQNPILSSTTIDTARQELVARLPKLVRLNRQEVEREERRGAELDFLKRYGKAWIESEKSGETARSSFSKRFPSFSVLCDKHGPPEAGEMKIVIHALKEGLVELIMSCSPPSERGPPEIVRRVPARMTVNHLRTLTRRIFHIPITANIDMVTTGVRPGFDHVEVPLDSDTREIGFFGIINGDKLIARWSPKA